MKNGWPAIEEFQSNNEPRWQNSTSLHYHFWKKKYIECTLSFLTDYIDLYADESKPSFSSVSIYQAMNFRCYFRGKYTETKEKLLINTNRMADLIYTYGQNGGKISAFFAVGGKDGDLVFIRPFEKRTYYAMAMSVRLSVCPSVRPSEFSGLFFNVLWDINLKLGICIQ